MKFQTQPHGHGGFSFNWGGGTVRIASKGLVKLQTLLAHRSDGGRKDRAIVVGRGLLCGVGSGSGSCVTPQHHVEDGFQEHD
jgi:hypothetical protein